MDDKYKNIVFDQWLANIMRKDVYRIIVDDDFIKLSSRKDSKVYKIVIALQNKPVFMFSKVGSMYIDSIRFLENLGFNLVDTNITFEKPITIREDFVGNCSVRFAVPDDQNQVVNLSRKSFVFTRFHLDLAIANSKANEVKGEWVRNFFLGNRGDQMIVALVDKKIVGFAQLLHGKDKTLIIDQIAVNDEHRRKGIAEDMIAFTETKCKGFSKISVGTQIANIPSINLYEKIGFKISDTQYVFHYHKN